MLRYLIPLIESYFSSGLFQWFFIPVLCLAFISTVPCLIRELVRSR